MSRGVAALDSASAAAAWVGWVLRSRYCCSFARERCHRTDFLIEFFLVLSFWAMTFSSDEGTTTVVLIVSYVVRWQRQSAVAAVDATVVQYAMIPTGAVNTAVVPNKTCSY